MIKDKSSINRQLSPLRQSAVSCFSWALSSVGHSPFD
jgi:hypothetical protein